MTIVTDDPVRDSSARDAEHERWLETRPICDMCGGPVQDDHYYTDGCIDVCCPDCWGQYCIDNFLVDIRED